MAAIPKNAANLSMFSSTQPAKDKLPGGAIAGEAIALADVVSLHSDGLYYKATTSTTRAGVAGAAADIGDPVTPTIGLRFPYGSGLTPGAPVYLSGSVAGGLDTVAQTNDCSLGFVLDDGIRIQFYEKLNN